MKKNILCLTAIFSTWVSVAQNLSNEKITVLKGGITVLRFAGDIEKFTLDNKESYNINVEEDRSIRIWAKSGVASPMPTTLSILEGNRSHKFQIQFKEKGDFNATFYDYTNLKSKSDIALTSLPNATNTTKNVDNATVSLQEKKMQEQRAAIIAEEKRKREERLKLEQKRLQDISEKNKIETERKAREESEKKLAAERKLEEETNKLLLEEKMKKMAAEQKIAAEKRRQQELEQQIERERLEKQEKEAALLAQKQKKQTITTDLSKVSKADEINIANTKKAREENERRLEEIKNAQSAQIMAIEEEKAKREQLMALLEAEKKSQELLDQRIAAEKRIKEERLATERKEKEAATIAAEKKRIELELAEARRLEEDRLATEKRIREENERKLAMEKQRQQEAIQALLNTKKEQEELMQKLQIEKQQREALEKMLAEQKLRRLQKEKELEVQASDAGSFSIQKDAVDTKIASTTVTTTKQNTPITTDPKPAVQISTSTELEPAVVDLSSPVTIQQIFPNINFNAPPTGQIMESNTGLDMNVIQQNCSNAIISEQLPDYANANTEMDGMRFSLINIKQDKDLAYVTFDIANNTPDYFLLGTTTLKILDAETGNKIQLNPYHVSAFPAIEAGGLKRVVYVMKAIKNISPDSFVMITMRERQTNKKFELNFPGNLYTNVVK